MTMNTQPQQTHRTPPKVPRPYPAPIVLSPRIVQLAETLYAIDDNNKLGGGDSAHSHARHGEVLDRFWAEIPQTPLIEPSGTIEEQIITFLWRDATAEEVLLFVNRITDERKLDESRMLRVPGTDVWHLSYRMRTDWRASYCFLVKPPGESWSWEENGVGQIGIRHALDRGQADPLNPRTNRNRVGTRMSVVELQKVPSQTWLRTREPGSPAGAVTEVIAPDARTVWVYRSPGATDDAPLPVVVVLDGDVWVGPRGGLTKAQDLPTTLDNLLADGKIPPCIAVFVDSGGRDRRWADMGEGGGQSAWVAERLLPWVRLHFPVSTAANEVVVAGQSLGGYTALRAALEYPQLVGCALAQSPSLWQRELPIPKSATARGLSVYLEVGTQEWVLREPARRSATALRAAGTGIRYVEFNGGHDYACWRGGIADGLRALLGERPDEAKIGEWIGDGDQYE